MSDRVAEPRLVGGLVDGVCPVCGATTDLNVEVLYDIERVMEWKRQDPKHAAIYDACIEELRGMLHYDSTGEP